MSPPVYFQNELPKAFQWFVGDMLVKSLEIVVEMVCYLGWLGIQLADVSFFTMSSLQVSWLAGRPVELCRFEAR